MLRKSFPDILDLEPRGRLTQHRLIDIASTTETIPGRPHCYGLRVTLRTLDLLLNRLLRSNHSALAISVYNDRSTKITTLCMPREKILRVRLSDKEFEILKEYAASTDMQISEVIRDYIKELSRKKPLL